MKKTLYMKVTNDEYELPVAVADSQRELARMLGISNTVISHAIGMVKHGVLKNSTYKIVEIDE